MLKKLSFILLGIIIGLFIISTNVFALGVVRLEPAYFPESARGRPISSAYIYVGKPDLDPEIVANQKQISIQQEDGTIVAISQPLRTSAGGIPLYLGSPVTILVDGDYSLKVLNKSGTQVYYVPRQTYTATSSEVGLVYCYPNYTETDHGATGTLATFKSCVDDIGATVKGTIFFKHNSGGTNTDYRFQTSDTSTSNIDVKFENGARFDPDSGKTITINSPEHIIANPNQQIKTGDGTLSFTKGGKEYPPWRGATGDGSTNDYTAIQDTFNSAKHVKFPAGSFTYSTALTIPVTLDKITGEGGRASILLPDGVVGLNFVATARNANIITIEDIAINGGGNTNTTTGRGIQALGTADTAVWIGKIRINRVQIYNINTAIHFRGTRALVIENSSFLTYFGIRMFGQNIGYKFTKNEITEDDTMGTGISRGIQIEQTSDYDPGGSTTKKSEDAQIYKNEIFGHDIGIDHDSTFVVNMSDNVISSEDIGINFTTADGTTTIEKNFIDLKHAGGIYGIKMNNLIAVIPRRVVNILGNYVRSSAPATNSVGIFAEQNQGSLNIKENSVIDMTDKDVELTSITNVNVVDNYLGSDVTYALRMITNTGGPGGLIRVEGNFFKGTVYFHPTSSLAMLDMGFNQGTFSTRIRGFSTMALNGTTITTTYASLTPTPPDFDAAGTTFLEPQLFIYGPKIELGYCYGTANATEVTINCSDNSHAETEIHWEVVLFQTFR